MLGNYFKGQKAKTGSFLVTSTKGSPALVIVLFRISVRICTKGRTLCGIRQSVCLSVCAILCCLPVSLEYTLNQIFFFYPTTPATELHSVFIRFPASCFWNETVFGKSYKVSLRQSTKRRVPILHLLNNSEV